MVQLGCKRVVCFLIPLRKNKERIALWIFVRVSILLEHGLHEGDWRSSRHVVNPNAVCVALRRKKCSSLWLIYRVRLNYSWVMLMLVSLVWLYWFMLIWSGLVSICCYLLDFNWWEVEILPKVDWPLSDDPGWRMSNRVSDYLQLAAGLPSGWFVVGCFYWECFDSVK